MELIHRLVTGMAGGLGMTAAPPLAPSTSASSVPPPDWLFELTVVEVESLERCLPTCFLRRRLMVSVFW